MFRFEAAEEHPDLHTELGGADHVFNKVGVELERCVLEADEDFMPLVEGVGDLLASWVLRVWRIGEFC